MIFISPQYRWQPFPSGFLISVNYIKPEYGLYFQSVLLVI